MKGTVKWFSKQKGYGYIVAESQDEHYFNIQAIEGTQLPKAGDVVEFTAYTGRKSLNAKNIKILESHATDTNDEVISPLIKTKEPKVRCIGCNRKMVPMLIYENHVFFKGTYPSHSICPFCATTFQKLEDGCFIATAVYEDRLAPEVIALRRFRDEQLSHSTYGQYLVSIYYKVAPHIAQQLKHHPRIRASLKPVLNHIAQYYS